MAKDKKKTTTRASKAVQIAAAIGQADQESQNKGAVLKTDDKDVAIIRPAKTKYGRRRNWREFEFAQLAIQSLYGANPPRILDHSKLTRDVNAWLRGNVDWQSSGYGMISRPTVLRALKAVFP
jgi:hypothetical protein